MDPIALGTETNGSILVPGDRASLYSLKLTVGKVSMHGVLPFTHLTDSLGPMAKSPEDIAAVLDILTPIQGRSYQNALTKSFKGLRVGFLDPIEWASGPGAVRPNEDFTKQTVSSSQTSLLALGPVLTCVNQHDEIAAAADMAEKAGATVKRNIKLRRFSPKDDKMFNDVSGMSYYYQTYIPVSRNLLSERL